MTDPLGSRLRVCYVVSYFHPYASGAERQALAQGIELARRGHTVHVVTHAVPGYPIRDEEYEGIFIHRWVESLHIGPLFAPTFVAGVIQALRQLRSEFDLVHTHQALWEAVATGLGRRWLRGAPTLVQPASSGYYGEAEELARTRGANWLRRAILQNTAFAAISADIERQWTALGVPPQRIVRTASGVDADHFRPGPSSVDATLLPRPRVMFTGRLHPQKNLDLLLDAWTKVARQTSANLILVGPGPRRDRLIGRTRDLGIADRVQFTGAVADPTYRHARAADLPVRLAERRRRHEQLAPGGDGDRPGLRGLGDRRQYRPPRRRPDRAPRPRQRFRCLGLRLDRGSWTIRHEFGTSVTRPACASRTSSPFRASWTAISTSTTDSWIGPGHLRIGGGWEEWSVAGKDLFAHHPSPTTRHPRARFRNCDIGPRFARGER